MTLLTRLERQWRLRHARAIVLTILVLALFVIAYVTHNDAYAKYDTLEAFTASIHRYADASSNFDDAIATMTAVRSQVDDSKFTGPGINETHDFAALYAAMEGGHTVLCNDMATMLEYAYSTQGVKAARYNLKGADGVSTHVTTDVLVKGHWTNIDATFAGYYTHNEEVLSTPQIHDLVTQGKLSEVVFHAVGPWKLPRPASYVIDPRLLYYEIERQNPIIPSQA